MLLPLGTDRYKTKPIFVTYALIAANILVYVASRMLERSNPNLVADFEHWAWLVPGHTGWWTYVTYSFIHAGLGHLVFNMLALWVFGPDVEDRIGRLGFIAMYVVGAIAAGVGHAVLTEPGPGVVGASGAITAVTGSFLVFFPFVRVRTLFFVFLYHLPAWWYIAFAIATDIFGLSWGRSNTAFGAHLGGYILGFTVSVGLLWLKILPREPYELFTVGRQAARRRAFRTAHARTVEQSPVARRRGEPAVVKPEGPAAEARMRVQELLSAGDGESAATAYLDMVAQPGAEKLPPLGRVPLYEIANKLFERGDHVNAAEAYQRFLDEYESDGEAPRVLLMLGVLHARYLNDPIAAKDVLSRAVERLTAEEEERLAREILEELG